MSRFLKKNYLKELTLDGQASQLEKDFESWLEDEIKVRGNEIERRHNITPEVFYEEYRQPGRPVILTGLTDNWTARQKWNFDF
nr:cupin-like domain-containing protein [Gammaproteobacteria bacterium]